MRKLSNGMQKEILQMETPCWKGQLERLLVDNWDALRGLTDTEVCDLLFRKSSRIRFQQVEDFYADYPRRPNEPISFYKVPTSRKEIIYSLDMVTRKREQNRIHKQLKRDAEKQLQLN